jgi:hypothetical protein
MTTRIIHQKTLPKTIFYWDYHILCHLNDKARAILQQFEYWDGTKAAGNIHSEQINDQLAAAGKEATQDTSRYIYKTQEELSWELSGTCSERSMLKSFALLCDELHYLAWRPNPYNSFDHTGQYAFRDIIVQSHLNRLYAIIKHFREKLGRRERPVLYAIEQLTEAGHFIAHTAIGKDGEIVEIPPEEKQPANLSIKLVAKKLREMHKIMQDEEGNTEKGKRSRYSLPRFIRQDLKKDEAQGFGPDNDLPYRLRKIAESSTAVCEDSNTQNCRMDSEKLQDGLGKIAGTIPVTTTVTTTSTTEEESAPVESSPTAPPNIPASSHSQSVQNTGQSDARRMPSPPRPILAEKDPFEEQKRQDARTLEALPEAQRAVVDAFRSKVHGYLPLTRDFLGEAKTLAGYGATADEIVRCYTWLTEQPYYREQGISLHDVEHNFVKWRSKHSAKKVALAPLSKPKPVDPEEEARAQAAYEAQTAALSNRRSFTALVGSQNRVS